MLRKLIGSVALTSAMGALLMTGAVRTVLAHPLAPPPILVGDQGSTPPNAVLTYHNDNGRTGQFTKETILTPTNVNVQKFGLLFNDTVDGYVYAQPLYMPNVPIGGAYHNVVFVCTEHDTVYAFDADKQGSALWMTSFLVGPSGTTVTSVPNADVNTGDIVPEIGITATPVIYFYNWTMYVEAKTKETNAAGAISYVHRLHALDIRTGLEQLNSPVVINAIVPGNGDGNNGRGQVPWNPLRQAVRPALLYNNGVVYVASASHGDNGPYHGWVFGYDAGTLQQKYVLNLDPNGGLGGVWMAGAGIACDMIGNMYLATGNGTFDADPSLGGGIDYGDSVVRLLPSGNTLKVTDYFAPFNQAYLESVDADQGSGGVLMPPTQTGAHPNILIQVGKTGTVYVINRDNMSHFHANGDQTLQALTVVNGLWSMPAYWNNCVYFMGAGDALKAFSLVGGVMSTKPTSQSSVAFGYPGATPSISSNGNTNGIAWVIQSDAYGNPGPAILHAFNASNVNQELYNSAQAPGGRDKAGNAVKFTVPTVTTGKVYIGTANQLDVYGPGNFAFLPRIAAERAVSANPIQVSISDDNAGADIRYTVDGSDPTLNSAKYTGPFTVSSSADVRAKAFVAGINPSGIAAASFLAGASIGTGNGLSAAYFSTIDLTGRPVTQIDPTANFSWNGASPAPGIPEANWSARWTGTVQPLSTGTWTFYSESDDGIRVWVNNQLIIDNWTYHKPTENSSAITLVAGQRYNIKVEYFKGGGQSQMQLLWSTPGVAKQAIPQSQLYSN